MSPLPDSTALGGLNPRIRTIPLENISALAGGSFGDPDVIALWFGEGDVRTPAFIGEAMMRAVEAGEVFYTSQNGIPPLRQALATYLSDLGEKPIAPDRITVTTSGMHAIQIALELILAPGDSVVIIDPVWPNFGAAAQVIGANIKPVRMNHGNAGWTLDLDKVAAALDPTVKAVFFASPGNPTGAMIPIETQVALLDMCRARGIWVIADEVYNRFVFGQSSAPTLLDHAEPEDRVLIVNSFSKNYCMTGWRMGWLVHPPSLGPSLAMVVQYSTSGVTTFIQHAGVTAIEQGEPFIEYIRGYCERGMGIACDALERMGRVRLGPRPVAGMYAFFEVDGMPDARAACREILEKTKVGLAPGTFFGPGSEGFLRACISREPESLGLAMERLAGVLG
jgi:aspartate/methionine/tyrosine aminotransferase